MELIAILSGILLGALTGLLPGLHLATALVIILGAGTIQLLSPEATALMIASATGTTLYTRHLSKVFQPTAQSQLPFADPAVRMAYNGSGHDALAIFKQATIWAVLSAIPIGLAFLLLAPLGFQAGKVPTWLAIGVILFWALATIFRARNRTLTLIGILVAGLYGYASLHHPQVRLSEHALAPMLAGLFAIPAAVLIFWESTRQATKPFPVQRPASQSLEVPNSLALKGSIIGALTGFLAGIGAGSLVASLHDPEQDPNGETGYTLVQATAETTNDLMAIALALALGLGRSGEAAILSNTLLQNNLALQLACLSALLLGLAAGALIVSVLTPHYVRLVTRLDTRLFAGLALLMGLGGAAMAAGLTGIAIALAGLGIALFLRMSHVPAQTSLAALAIPVVVYYAGLVPALNAILY